VKFLTNYVSYLAEKPRKGRGGEGRAQMPSTEHPFLLLSGRPERSCIRFVEVLYGGGPSGKALRETRLVNNKVESAVC